VCLSTCVDTYFADAPATFAVRERYAPVALEVGLPQAQLPLRPRDGDLVELAVTAHRARLLRELSMTVPDIIVTLGNPALRVLRAITEAKGGLGKLHPDARYGVEQTLVWGTRKAAWLALTHHEADRVFAEAHGRWRQSRLSRL